MATNLVRPSKTAPPPVARKPKGAEDGFVGFGNLPTQVGRKCVRKGFQFTLMVVGESGLGKSTLVNSLFLTDLYVASTYDQPIPKVSKSFF